MQQDNPFGAFCIMCSLTLIEKENQSSHEQFEFKVLNQTKKNL